MCECFKYEISKVYANLKVAVRSVGCDVHVDADNSLFVVYKNIINFCCFPKCLPLKMYHEEHIIMGLLKIKDPLSVIHL